MKLTFQWVSLKNTTDGTKKLRKWLNSSSLLLVKPRVFHWMILSLFGLIGVLVCHHFPSESGLAESTTVIYKETKWGFIMVICDAGEPCWFMFAYCCVDPNKLDILSMILSSFKSNPSKRELTASFFFLDFIRERFGLPCHTRYIVDSFSSFISAFRSAIFCYQPGDFGWHFFLKVRDKYWWGLLGRSRFRDCRRRVT